MSSKYDYKKFAILYVDDEVMSLKYFARAFEDEFRIYTAASAKEGLAVLEEHKDDIGLIISDQRMPGENGVWLFERARELRPSVIRILATAYSDFDAAIEAVNSGAIYKYITKPWELTELESTLKRGLEFFMVEKERDQLMREKMSVLHDMMTGDRIISLGLLTAGMSHHIRNALVPVKTFLDLLPEQIHAETNDADVEILKSEFWTDYYQQAVQKLGKISGLLSDLWNASEKQMFHFSDRVALKEIFDEVLGKVGPKFEQRRISIGVSLADDLPELIVDRPKFTRLFELLFQDELVSLPEGSSVRVSAKAISLGSDGPQVQIVVSDDGPGLPQENQRFVFDPFVARSDSPMEYGINLMACYFIVYHHGGRIGAESSGGNGTTFTMRFHADPKRRGTEQIDPESSRKPLLDSALWEKTLAAH